MSSFDIPLISFGGLATGLDTNAIISSLVAVEKLPINLMLNQKAGYQSKFNAFDTLKTHLKALETAAENLKDPTDFNVFSVTASQEGVVTASASSSAAAGAYEISVESLAAFEQKASGNHLDKDTTTFGTGTLVITAGTTMTNVTIEPGQDTLEGIAAAINASGAEVTASVINDGSQNPSGQYRLVITNNNTGLVEGAVTVDASGLSGGDQTLTVDQQLQASSDAHFYLNGLEMFRSTNTVDDAITGLSFALTGTTAANQPVTLTVSRDTEAIQEKIQAFADAYNEVIKFINQQNTFVESSGTGGALIGESLLYKVQTKLQSLLTPQWETGADAPEVQILAQIGISFENDGTLTVETGELETALGEHFDDIQDMFSNAGFGDEVDTLLNEYTKFDGFVDGRKKAFEELMEDLDDQIQNAEDRVDQFEASLIKKFAALESLMVGLQSQQSFLAYQAFPNFS